MSKTARNWFIAAAVGGLAIVGAVIDSGDKADTKAKPERGTYACQAAQREKAKDYKGQEVTNENFRRAARDLDSLCR